MKRETERQYLKRIRKQYRIHEALRIFADVSLKVMMTVFSLALIYGLLKA